MNSVREGLPPVSTPAQKKVAEIIFGTETFWGKWFDLILIGAIITSVMVIFLDSVPSLHERHKIAYFELEWFFTAFFTIEYAVRIWCSPNRRKYVFSIWGVVDLLAILPTYIALLLPQAAPLLIIRLLRTIRIFRVLRLFKLMSHANKLGAELRKTLPILFVYFAAMLIITIIFGCIIYVLEGPNNGFDSIPSSIYWAIVTFTTVGYGDVVPITIAGRAVAALGMLLGFLSIAVATGIIAAAILEKPKNRNGESASTPSNYEKNCRNCARAGHEQDAQFCKYCGSPL
jgi:voltage-gated potassium channel